MSRRGKRILIVLVLVGLLGYAGYAVPSGYFAFFPGDALPVTPMVKVESGAADAKGTFYMTTISAREANFFIYLYAKVDPRVSLKTREEYLPRGMDLVEYNKYSQRLMDESRAIASVIGLKLAGVDAYFTGKGVKAVEIMTDGPAYGKLQPGDIIISADGVATDVAEQFTDYMAKVQIGQTLNLRIRRKDQEIMVALEAVEHPTQKGRAAVRIRIETESPSFYSPVKVDIDPGNVTGPSAGLMFTLEVANQADHATDMTHGRRIAGTGTVNPSGKVGPVGGAAQKVAAAEREGAEYFLVPKDNLAEASQAARRIKIVPVDSVEDALQFLTTL
jgi:PDZ domain-containing protein